MSIGSGIGSSFGYKVESTWGTRAAPDKFIRHRSASLVPMFNRVQGEGIQSGALGLRGDHLVQTHQGATASVEFDVVTLNMLSLIKVLMGGGSSAQQGGTAAYLHTFTLADTLTDSLTMQVNVPLRGGTDKAKEVTGAKPTSATFSCGVGEILTSSMEFDCEYWDDSQSLASPSYVSGVPYHFGEAALKLGTYSSESAVTGVRAFSCTIERPHDTEAYRFGSTTKQEQILNAPTSITGSIEADYIATADFEERMTDMTLPSLVFECVGTVATGKPAIATTYFPTFRITLPGVHITGNQTTEGYDVPRTSWDYEWKYDGTNLPNIQIMSSETSIP